MSDSHPYDTRGKRRMHAYYFSFVETGCQRVDRLLAEIAWAGKCYHSTEWWDESEQPDEPSHIDRIQAAAQAIADALEASDDTTVGQ